MGTTKGTRPGRSFHRLHQRLEVLIRELPHILLPGFRYDPASAPIPGFEMSANEQFVTRLKLNQAGGCDTDLPYSPQAMVDVNPRYEVFHEHRIRESAFICTGISRISFIRRFAKTPDP